MNRPRIGINTDFAPGQEGKPDRQQIARAYVDAVVRAGGLPVLLTSTDDEALARDLLALLDGVVLTGGLDYPSAAYGGPDHPEIRILPDERTRSDLLLGRLLFSESRLPVLGICLGAQLLTISLGGRLVPHVPTAERHKRARPGQDNEHAVRITASGRLRDVFPEERITVNSAHHQAVDPAHLPRGLRITAIADDGVVEAVEGCDPDRFVLGVQWHPERIRDEEHRQRLFAAFLAACGRAGTRTS